MADQVDWNALAAEVQANFAATGRWFLGPLPGPGPAPSITRASTSAGGEQGNNTSVEPALSADGTKVAFYSYASNLVPGDTNGLGDILVKDLATGEVRLADTSSGGEQANTYYNFDASFVGGGDKVAFSSFSSNLVPGDTNGKADIFLKDLATGELTRLSTSGTGEQGNGDSTFASFSADGKLMAFESDATNLVPGGNGAIFLKDLTTGEVTVAVAHPSEGPYADGPIGRASLSADGTKLAFAAYASNLVPEDTDSTPDVFVKDLTTGVITRVSTSAGGEAGDAPSFGISISADGGTVAIESYASNLGVRHRMELGCP